MADRHHVTNAVILLLVVFSFVTAPTSLIAQQIETPAERSTRGTVGIISGSINGTYIHIASDLAAVLDDGNNLRILPIVGKGSLQNIKDILFLKGVDIGIVQSDVFAFVKREQIFPRIDRKIHYITKLYNEEIHLLARGNIETVQDLKGRNVNFGLRGSGTNFTAKIVFDVLRIEVNPEFLDQALALERLKSGEISALVYVAGKPTKLFQDVTLKHDVHFIPLVHSAELLQTYLPSWLTHDDYPHLIPSGKSVDTLAVGAVMAVYNFKPGSVRYGKVTRFIDSFIFHFTKFLEPPRHAKWQEVNLWAEVPGWTRFSYAESVLE